MEFLADAFRSFLSMLERVLGRSSALRGSLDHPPLLIRKSRAKPVLFLFLLLLLLLAAVIIMATGTDTGDRDLRAFIAFWAFAALFAAWPLLRPASLTLDPDGLVFRSGGEVSRYSWDDVYRFTEEDLFPGRSFPSLFVVSCEFMAHAAMNKQNSAFDGPESFGGFWELESSELAALLNDARWRWAKTPQLRDQVARASDDRDDVFPAGI